MHYVPDLAAHTVTANRGPNALDLTLDPFRALLRGRRGTIKPFLLNQKRVAGIGNVYVQDPLFKAGIHPLRRIDTLSDDEVAALWRAIRETPQESIDRGGSAWEFNLYGEKGGWDESFLRVGYREEQPCPACGTTVVKIKTGSTSSYICPECQPLEVKGLRGRRSQPSRCSSMCLLVFDTFRRPTRAQPQRFLEAAACTPRAVVTSLLQPTGHKTAPHWSGR